MFGQIAFEQDTSADLDTNIYTDAPKQLFNINDLPTQSVVLYSTRAHIVRNIPNVMLKPGPNEVEIYGLSPTVDEHSIQVESQGLANVADITVQLIHNRERFEEVYPEDTDTSDDDTSDEEFLDSDDDEENLRSISDELKSLHLQVAKATETQNSANERLSTWDRYARSANSEHISPDDMVKLLSKYDEDRTAIFKTHNDATAKLQELKKTIRRKEHEKMQIGKGSKKEKEKAQKKKAKEQQRKRLQKLKKTTQAKHLRAERQLYWPKKVFKVTLLLERTSLDTPGSSRRSSIDSVTLASVAKIPDDVSKDQIPVNLKLSYVTREAGWTPRYDVRISTVQNTATIVYRTEFLNHTSETWKDTKVSFSTSQTSYQGLDDVVPFMHSWRVKLARYNNYQQGGLLSPEEAEKPRVGRPGLENYDRAEMFGHVDVPAWEVKQSSQIQQSSTTGGLFAGSVKAPGGQFGQSNNPPSGGSLFGSSTNDTYGYGSAAVQENATPAHNEAQARLVPSAAFAPKPKSRGVEHHANVELNSGIQSARRKSSRKMGPSLFSSSKMMNISSSISRNDDEASPEDSSEEETGWEDNGLTATYDIPGTRTLAPSSLMRHHKIASLHAANIHVSHIAVPKLRSAAFLRTKIRNPSTSITLLKGSAGVTLDGSFLGNMTLPRVSPSQLFDLPLGVDPGIHVNYPKPSLHHSTQGIIFNKETSQIFTRSIWLNNTKTVPVNLLVLDQIPVSEDERLKIGILTPKGLSKEGDSVRAGVSAKEGSGAVSKDKGEAWGSAVAKMKKNGEVGWTVKVDAGKGCLLKLEYEARLPQTEKIQAA